MDIHHIGDNYFHHSFGHEVFSGQHSCDEGHILVFPRASLLIFTTNLNICNFRRRLTIGQLFSFSIPLNIFVKLAYFITYWIASFIWMQMSVTLVEEKIFCLVRPRWFSNGKCGFNSSLSELYFSTPLINIFPWCIQWCVLIIPDMKSVNRFIFHRR